MTSIMHVPLEEQICSGSTKGLKTKTRLRQKQKSVERLMDLVPKFRKAGELLLDKSAKL